WRKEPECTNGSSYCCRPERIRRCSEVFDQRSIIALASSRILELGGRLWNSYRPLGQNRSLAAQRKIWVATCAVGPLLGQVNPSCSESRKRQFWLPARHGGFDQATGYSRILLFVFLDDSAESNLR